MATEAGNRAQPSPSASPRMWLTGSELHMEFVALCERKGWEKRKYLPRKGDKQAKELDELINKGLGPGKPLSRDQVNRKFAQWKNLLESEVVECPLLDPTNIASAEEILLRLEKTECWKDFLCKQKVDMFADQSPMLVVVLSQGTWLLECVRPLRDALIDLVNRSLEQQNTSRVRGAEIDSKAHSDHIHATLSQQAYPC